MEHECLQFFIFVYLKKCDILLEMIEIVSLCE